MGFRRRAGGGKRDTMEAAIVQALRAVGVGVWQLGGTGNPDLLCRLRHGWLPLEVKSGHAGTLTMNQQSLQWPVVRSVDEALQAVGAVRTRSDQAV